MGVISTHVTVHQAGKELTAKMMLMSVQAIRARMEGPVPMDRTISPVAVWTAGRELTATQTSTSVPVLLAGMEAPAGTPPISIPVIVGTAFWASTVRLITTSAAVNLVGMVVPARTESMVSFVCVSQDGMVIDVTWRLMHASITPARMELPAVLYPTVCCVPV
jgi:hypothetical protein